MIVENAGLEKIRNEISKIIINSVPIYGHGVLARVMILFLVDDECEMQDFVESVF